MMVWEWEGGVERWVRKGLFRFHLGRRKKTLRLCRMSKDRIHLGLFKLSAVGLVGLHISKVLNYVGPLNVIHTG